MKHCVVCNEPILSDEAADEANADREFVEYEDEWFHIGCLLDAGVVRCPNCGEWFEPKK